MTVDLSEPDPLMGIRPAVLAALARHPDAVLVGTTAALVWGGFDQDRVADVLDPIEMAVEGGGVRPLPGVRVRRDRLDAGEVVEHDGLRLTSPTRTAYDLARRLTTVEAVVLIETLARRHGVTVDGVRGIADAHPHARGLARLWAALALVEPRVASTFQSRLRLAVMLGGLRAPVVDHVVVGHVVGGDLGRSRGEADLAWPEERCGLLCDRDDTTAHLMGDQLVLAGWTIRRFTREQFAAHPDRMVEDVGYMLRRSRRRLGLDGPVHLGWTRPRRRRATIRTYP